MRIAENTGKIVVAINKPEMIGQKIIRNFLNDGRDIQPAT
jgi:hypothetical protein